MIYKDPNNAFEIHLILKVVLGWIGVGIELIESIRRSMHGCQGLSQTGQSFGEGPIRLIFVSSLWAEVCFVPTATFWLPNNLMLKKTCDLCN